MGRNRLSPPPLWSVPLGTPQLTGGDVLQPEVILGRQAQASTKKIHDTEALGKEGVHHGLARVHHGCLEEVRKRRTDRGKLLRCAHAIRPPGYPLHQFAEDAKVKNQRGRQEAILADVVKADGAFALSHIRDEATPPCVKDPPGQTHMHKNATGVLVQGPLAVTHGGHVFDDHNMVWVLGRPAIGNAGRPETGSRSPAPPKAQEPGCNRLEKNPVGGHHVVHHVALANLLGAKLGRRREVFPITAHHRRASSAPVALFLKPKQQRLALVAQVVIGGDALGLDASGDQEINKDTLHLQATKATVPGPAPSDRLAGHGRRRFRMERPWFAPT